MIYAGPFLLAFAVSLALTPGVRAVALWRGWVSTPSPDRWHQRDTALFGGVAIYGATVVAFLQFVPIQNDQTLLGILVGGSFMFLVGLIDDIKKSPPYAKLLGQIVAACTAVYSGISFEMLPTVLAVPVTVLWIVGVTNAFNLIDNMDGLAAGIAVIAGGILFFYSYLNDVLFVALVSLALVGASLGFLIFNFHPARIFMGDSGSMFIGYLVAVVAIMGTANHVSSLLATLIVPITVLGVPIFDTAFVTLLRRVRGSAITQGGRDHASHRLVTLGLSERKAVLLIYAISVLFGAVAFFYARVDISLVVIMTVLTAILLLIVGRFLSEVKIEEKPLSASAGATTRPVLINTMLVYKRQFLEVLIDFALICIAYYSAYLVRFEGVSSEWYLPLFIESLPMVIAVQLGAFFLFGLYRNVWRYVSIQDLTAITKAVTLGSVLSVLLFTYLGQFQGYSRAVFVVYWLILFCLVAATRLFFRALREYFLRSWRGGKKVLIVGAGDAGEMLLREIHNNRKLNYEPVGFLDDDKEKVGREIHGLPILGTRYALKKEVRDRGIEEVLVAIPSAQRVDLSEIYRFCEESGIPFRETSGLFR
jgi:UDP-GlcNAc:undecaprenyl-phosphate GlcNAc-1-phosphate transferase